MGSSGSGKLGTYRIGGEFGDIEVGVNGGSLGTNEVECPRLIENVRLEDVATSTYYTNNISLPALQTKIQIRASIYMGRLVVETIATQEVIGNIPTQYNYLFNCIKRGMHYTGNVISSGITPIPYVVVTLNA